MLSFLCDWRPAGIYLSFIVLALLPLTITWALRSHFIRYKQRSLLDDLKKLRATESSLVKSRGGEAGVSREIEHYYSKLALMVPSALLSFLYIVLFGILYAHIARLFVGDNTWLFPKNISLTVPMITAFIGAYL